MKIKSVMKAVVLGASASDYDFDGRKGTSYKLSVKGDDGVGNLKCSEAVFKAYNVGVIQDYKEATFICEISDYRGGTLRIIDVASK